MAAAAWQQNGSSSMTAAAAAAWQQPGGPGFDAQHSERLAGPRGSGCAGRGRFPPLRADPVLASSPAGAAVAALAARSADPAWASFGFDAGAAAPSTGQSPRSRSYRAAGPSQSLAPTHQSRPPSRPSRRSPDPPRPRSTHRASTVSPPPPAPPTPTPRPRPRPRPRPGPGAERFVAAVVPVPSRGLRRERRAWAGPGPLVGPLAAVSTRAGGLRLSPSAAA
jgi:hypothetical protein